MSMATRASRFRILVATDGSDQARAAITMTMNVPWPARTQVRVVVAGRTDETAQSARRTLSRRWPDVDTAVLDKEPVDAILDDAERFGADAIVLGWRGHGAI